MSAISTRTPAVTRLRDLDVLDEFGAPVRLGNLWLDQTAILVFVRHFG